MKLYQRNYDKDVLSLHVERSAYYPFMSDEFLHLRK